jgi:hypothetical protein
MRKHLSSAKSAKDKYTLVDLDDLALAMHADSTFMSDTEYEAAQARLAKRKAILQPRKPIRLSKYGMFIAGICAGAILAFIINFAATITGPFAAISAAVSTGCILAVIGTSLGADE